jgi:starch synthase
MKTLFLTNEYSPSTYGGAGVHVEYLSRELASLMKVDVRAFGNQLLDTPNLKVRGFPVDTSKLGWPKTCNRSSVH